MTGRTLLHYNIVEKLGEGGMGVVWKARDTHLDRFVALKVLPGEKLSDPERKRRFVEEPSPLQRSITPTSSPFTTSPTPRGSRSLPWTALERTSYGRCRPAVEKQSR